MPYPCIISGQAIKVWFSSQRTMYGKLTKQAKSGGQADKKLTFRQKWVLGNFNFLEAHLKVQTTMWTMGAQAAQSSELTTTKVVDDDVDEKDPEAEDDTEASPLVSGSQPLPTASTSTTTTIRKPATKRKKGGKHAQVDAYIRTIAEKMSGAAKVQAQVNIFLHLMKIFSKSIKFDIN